MRLSTSAAGLALALASLTACGGGADKLSGDEREEALLTTDNLGSEFEVDDDDDDDDDDSFGCLAEADDLGGDGDKSEIAFGVGQDADPPAVLNAIKSYDDEDEAEEQLSDFVDSLEDCDSIDETDEDGVAIKLDVEHDEDEAEGADQQVNVDASGTVGQDGQEFPIVVSFRVARVENNLVGIGFFTIGDDSSPSEQLLDASIERLQAVMDDEDVPEPEPLLEDLTNQGG